MAIITQTQRLIIREYLPDEEELFVELLADPRLTAYLPKRNAEENRKIFRDTIAEYTQGIKLSRWGIFDLSGQYIGFAMLRNTETEPKTGELGYVIHEKFKGTGLATDVSIALINYGFKKLGLTEVIAVTVPENIPSQRVLLKAGMQPGNDIMRNGMWLSYFSLKTEL